MTAAVITCPWCDRPVEPNGPRMRVHHSETTAFSGKTLAHFHVECGDVFLDFCEARTEARKAGQPNITIAT